MFGFNIDLFDRRHFATHNALDLSCMKKRLISLMISINDYVEDLTYASVYLDLNCSFGLNLAGSYNSRDEEGPLR